MPTQTGVATSDKVLNVSGLLTARTDPKTPLFNMIGANPTVDHDDFILGAQYDMEEGHQAGVSETASLTAPAPTFIERENTTNVTQIYQRTVDVSYKTQSNRGNLAGNDVVLASQGNSIAQTEFDWQLARKIEKVRDDIEYNILNSTYNKAATAAQTQTTRGLIQAVTTNVVDAGGDELNANPLNKAVRMASETPFGGDGLVFILNPEQLQQFTNNLINLWGQQPAINRSVAGANIIQYITPFGTVGVMAHRYMPNGTAVGVHFSLLANQWQPVPNKGAAIFYEQLAKVGASERGMLYAQHGLDYTHEWAHVKITGLATTTADIPVG